jgi:hypothetical protein
MEPIRRELDSNLRLRRSARLLNPFAPAACTKGDMAPGAYAPSRSEEWNDPPSPSRGSARSHLHRPSAPTPPVAHSQPGPGSRARSPQHRTSTSLRVARTPAESIPHPGRSTYRPTYTHPAAESQPGTTPHAEPRPPNPRKSRSESVGAIAAARSWGAAASLSRPKREAEWSALGLQQVEPEVILGWLPRAVAATSTRSDPVGFANSGGVVFVDESAEKVATT